MREMNDAHVSHASLNHEPNWNNASRHGMADDVSNDLRKSSQFGPMLVENGMVG